MINFDLRLHVDFFGCTPRANKCVGTVNRPIQRQPLTSTRTGTTSCDAGGPFGHNTAPQSATKCVDTAIRPTSVTSKYSYRHNVMRYSRPLGHNTVKTISGDAVQSAPCTQHCTTSTLSPHGVVGCSAATYQGSESIGCETSNSQIFH